eukprot:3442987-Prymnesium_polylepis.1
MLFLFLSLRHLLCLFLLCCAHDRTVDGRVACRGAWSGGRGAESMVAASNERGATAGQPCHSVSIVRNGTGIGDQITLSD